MAFVQEAQNAGTGSSITVTLGSNTTAGNALVVMTITAGSTNGSISGITLGGAAGNFASEVVFGTSGSHAIASCWSDPDCAGGQTSVVISNSGGSGTQTTLAWVYEISGMPSTGPLLDPGVSAGVSSSGSVSSWTLGPTSTTSQAVEVWLGVAGGNVSGTSVGTYTGPASPWANETQQGVSGASFSLGGISGYQVTSSTGTASYSGSVTPTSTIEGLVVALKAATGNTSSGSVGMAADAISGSGGQTFTGSGSVSGASLALSGAALEGNAGTGSVSPASLALSGTAAQIFTCSGSVSASALALAGNAGSTFTAFGSAGASALALAGSGTSGVISTGSVSPPVFALSGTGGITYTGSGNAAFAALALNGSAASGIPITSSGSVAIAANAISATGHQGHESSNLLLLGFI